MKIWLDAQLSPILAMWINEMFPNLSVHSVKSLGLRDAKDFEIFKKAKKANAVILSKDQDFVHLISKHGPPPQLIWVTCGNTSNARMKEIITDNLMTVIDLLKKGEPVVQITDK